MLYSVGNRKVWFGSFYERPHLYLARVMFSSLLSSSTQLSLGTGKRAFPMPLPANTTCRKLFSEPKQGKEVKCAYSLPSKAWTVYTELYLGSHMPFAYWNYRGRKWKMMKQILKLMQIEGKMPINKNNECGNRLNDKYAFLDSLLWFADLT